jgi:thiol-disulfide isomerase/thioredoxin
MRTRLGLVLSLLVLAGCDEKPSGPPPSRFAAVKKSTSAAAKAFCDQSYPASGDGAKRYVPAALRPFGQAPEKKAGWTWVNAWATWCTPCVEEMGMLNRWHEALERDGVPVAFELLSIDEADAEPKLQEWSRKILPGPIRWVKSQDDFGAFLDSIGVARDAAIPIHVLVDPKGMVRCVRVGAIHEQNYGAIRDLVSGS